MIANQSFLYDNESVILCDNDSFVLPENESVVLSENQSVSSDNQSVSSDNQSVLSENQCVVFSGLSTCTETEMEFKAQIEKLVGAANWSKWKRQIELLLRHHDVHDVVCRDRECPRSPAETEAIAAYEKAQKAFVKDDSLAQLILVGNMDDSNVELTSVCNTANSV
ncbi:uncharacterized protein TNCT_2061 [Trichonephila clavata]|uniref:Uncharacterized protein n=1 Tax=Trichonephila clavata TaxID=2740835 RepID=A0A8X6GRS6_TRICU|nr:uncharacterized protein TNCT_2061 [Trichonephila clavata]